MAVSGEQKIAHWTFVKRGELLGYVIRGGILFGWMDVLFLVEVSFGQDPPNLQSELDGFSGGWTSSRMGGCSLKQVLGQGCWMGGRGGDVPHMAGVFKPGIAPSGSRGGFPSPFPHHRTCGSASGGYQECRTVVGPTNLGRTMEIDCGKHCSIQAPTTS